MNTIHPSIHFSRWIDGQEQKSCPEVTYTSSKVEDTSTASIYRTLYRRGVFVPVRREGAYMELR
jgi:hypothetical protein